ncbi:MAG: zinc metallopeptidase [Clostridia bacterium]|nr:zinc metallopeptidase [Clostridia bacterium]
MVEIFGLQLDYMTLTLLVFVVFGLSIFASSRVRSVFSRYNQTPSQRGQAAHGVARELLYNAGSGVQIERVQGSLTDHYNSKTQTVGLSTEVYDSTSVAALAIAAHEIGHVMQYEEDYVPIKVRNAILPVARLGSQAGPILCIVGLLLSSYPLAIAGVALYAAMLLFQLFTLPVEFNASRRAIALLTDGGYITDSEAPAAKKVLRAAAMTYVLAALASLISLLRLLAIVSGTRRK